MKLWTFANRNNEDAGAGRPALSAMNRLLETECSRDQFRALLTQFLQDGMPGSTVEAMGESSLRIVSPEGKEFGASIDNIWISYKQDKKNRRILLDRYLGAAAAMAQPEPPLSKERIVATIRNAEFFSFAGSPDEIACEPLCGDLWIVYGEAFPDRIRGINRTEIIDSALDAGALRELALNNLDRIMPPQKRHGSGPWYAITAGGNYSASLLLFDSVWDAAVSTVDGDLVAVAPAREVVFYTGSGSAEGITAIRNEAAKVLATGKYLVSSTLLIRKGGSWTVFDPT